MQPDETGVLVLSEEYKEIVKKQHESMLDFAQGEQERRKLLVENDQSNSPFAMPAEPTSEPVFINIDDLLNKKN